MEIYSTGGANAAAYTSVQKKDAPQQAPQTAAGIAAQGGAAPDPSSPAVQNILSSLSEFFPSRNAEDVDILLARTTLEQQEVVGKTNTNELVAKEEQKRESLAEKTKTLEEAQKKQEEAEAKQKKGGFFNKLKQAFQAIGAVLTMAIGAALIATGVGGPVGVALVGLGAMQMVMMLDSLVAQHNDGFGLMGSMWKAMGASDDVARGFDIAFQVTMTVAIVAGAILTARADVAAAQFAQGAALVIGATTTIATSSLSVKSAVVNKEAAFAQAEAQDTQAKSQEMQAFTEILNDFIDQILNRISGAASQFNAMLDDISTSVKDRGDTLARANFTG